MMTDHSATIGPPLSSEHRRGVRKQALSVGLASALYGVSFGALSTASGLSVSQTCALSLLMFAGSAQFAFVGVIGAGGSGAAAIAGSALLSIRSLFYGIQLGPVLDVHGWRRTAAAQLTIDESTLVSAAQSSWRARRLGFWATAFAVYIGWNATTLLGAVVGDQLGDPRRYGLDAAAASAFLGLLWPRLRHLDAAAAAVLAALVTVLTTPTLPAGVPILAAAVVALILGALLPNRRPTPRPFRFRSRATRPPRRRHRLRGSRHE